MCRVHSTQKIFFSIIVFKRFLFIITSKHHVKTISEKFFICVRVEYTNTTHTQCSTRTQYTIPTQCVQGLKCVFWVRKIFLPSLHTIRASFRLCTHQCLFCWQNNLVDLYCPVPVLYFKKISIMHYSYISTPKKR